MSESWLPYADNNLITQRAELLAKIRQFMIERNILEVETPILSHATVTDVQLYSFRSDYSSPKRISDQVLYLQTSPEYAMKRLLASGLGAIYQISKVFRNEEQGKLHNPEFTMLEWYQPGFDHHQLMQEVELFLSVIGIGYCEKVSYGDIFLEHTGLNPHTCDKDELNVMAQQSGLTSIIDERSVLLDFIFSHKIAPTSGNSIPLFVYDYPECQCALAKLGGSTPKVAERFELFINGMEIANGFHELTDADEQLARFEQDVTLRKKQSLPDLPIDNLFLNALEKGLPDCAGVAVGIDRLLMVITGVEDIREVLAFPIDRA
jgi:elongation factor P--(R)-beta-lysine ligase